MPWPGLEPGAAFWQDGLCGPPAARRASWGRGKARGARGGCFPEGSVTLHPIEQAIAAHPVEVRLAWVGLFILTMFTAAFFANSKGRSRW